MSDENQPNYQEDDDLNSDTADDATDLDEDGDNSEFETGQVSFCLFIAPCDCVVIKACLMGLL